MMWSKLPLLDDEERIVGTVTVARDVTERKLAELALREQTDRLRYEDFVAMAANLSAYAGLTNVPGH